jgi:hypothetical protein
MADDAVAAQAGPCWCTLLPAVVPLPREAAAGCWCADCLRRHIAEAGIGSGAAAAGMPSG